jgi:dihydropyrimidinase
MSILIKGGQIITAEDDFVGDVLIEGETIAAVGGALDVDADSVIAATDMGAPLAPRAHVG